MSATMPPSENETSSMYKKCIQMQIDEIDLLSSIYCNPGELTFLDPSIITDFNEFVTDKLTSLRSKLDFYVQVTTCNNEKIEVRVELPHLYPIMENAIITLRSVLFSKCTECCIKKEIEEFIESIAESNRDEGYMFQVISWIQDKIDEFILKNKDLPGIPKDEPCSEESVEFERLWIYSHHIKSSAKRQKIVKNAKELELTGFSRPGKPGVICVEGLKTNTHEFWKLLKAMNWQKITIRKSEVKARLEKNLDSQRRWAGFREEMFTENDGNLEEGVMNMSLFMKYLDNHNSGYMKKELFGFD